MPCSPPSTSRLICAYRSCAVCATFNNAYGQFADGCGNTLNCGGYVPAGEIELGRIATWWGKVTIHRANGGAWVQDADCTSGANIYDLNYCKKFFPAATAIHEVSVTAKSGNLWYSAGCSNPAPGPGFHEYACTTTTNVSLSGSGTGGQNGTTCFTTYDYPVMAGYTYEISTCGSFSGDTYLKVTGACECTNDDANGGLGSACTCTATSDGTMTVCGSTFGTAAATWNYVISEVPTGGSGTLSGSGTGGQSGQTCFSLYEFEAIPGHTYQIQTCDNYTGDTYLVVSGACSCTSDDACGTGSACQCTADYTGLMAVCGSTYGSASGTWDYTVDIY